MKQYVVVDSRDRDMALFPDPGKYSFRLPQTFHHVVGARLMTAEVPTSFYVFSAARSNTSMVVALNGVQRVVTIPDGNYGFGTMALALQDALDAAFVDTAFTVAISATTLRLAVSTGSATDVLSVVTTGPLASAAPSQWGLAWYLGFDRNATATATGTLVSPRVVCCNPELYMLLDIAELNDVQEAGVYGAGGTSGPTFAKIPLNVPSFEYAFFDKQITANVMQPPLARLSDLHIAFRFHDGTPVHFQGVDHAFTIELDCSTERSTW